MTSAAMIAGMMPMALALGEGAEATAPLGRAVIGGLAARDARHADRPAVGVFARAAVGRRRSRPRSIPTIRRADTAPHRNAP